MNDKSIIDLFFARSEDAIGEVTAQYGPLIRNISRNILNNERDVEECTNDTYMALWDSIPPNRPESLIGYVCRLARNVSLNRYRYNTAEKRNSIYDVALDEIDEFVSDRKNVETEVEGKELARIIEEFLDGLAVVDRVLFVGRYYLSEAYQELAERTGLSEKNVSVRLTRIRVKLKKYLTQREVEV